MREKERATRVIYVRHGQADFPYDRLYCDDREDPPLTAEGREQAGQAAHLLQGEEVDVIYASPMQRTRTTAEVIAGKNGAALQCHDQLKERPFGIWDGLYFDAIARDYPDEFLAWKQDPVNFVPPGGETISDHRDRVIGAVAEIKGRHRGQTIVIVAHVGPIRMCITDALRMPLDGYRQLTIDYGALTRIDYGKHQDNLIFLNYRQWAD